MVRETFTVKNPSGWHTRPARLFVDTATADFADCEVKVIKGEKVINGKSVLSMLTLGVKFGDTVEVQAEGERAAEAVKELGSIVERIYQE